ncbi:MAG: SO_0444 family Cu/Zn efflux transporter, partial [Pseudomonadales bacterium]|nr:SO_0444 family Cu/Zn efflux transporter [Pseudomonadales bacterium]
MDFLDNLLLLTLESAPWLLVGLVVAGIIKAWMNEDWLATQLGDHGFGSVFKSALIGTPLPLCSCSVIPVALGVRRAGASKSSTVSFLVATPETGADSIALSYALLGPVMAIVRPVAAISSAVISGMLVAFFDREESVDKQSVATSSDSCCSKKSCCDSEPSDSALQTEPGTLTKLTNGLQFAFTSIFDDFIKWLAIGLVFAALVKTYVPESFLLEWGSGLVAMLVMIVVGIPMYICATASTPIAAALMVAGVSPGTALVFLLAG